MISGFCARTWLDLGGLTVRLFLAGLSKISPSSTAASSIAASRTWTLETVLADSGFPYPGLSRRPEVSSSR